MAPTEQLSVVVLAGGISHERDVSLRSGRRVADGLREQGWSVEVAEPDPDLLDSLTGRRPHVVWPALHGASGEDGGLLALLETTGLAIVGSSSAAARLAWDKPTAKILLDRIGISTPHAIPLTRDTFRELGAAGVLRLVLDRFALPVVVKPARGGSAQGVGIVQTPDLLPRAMVAAYTYGDEVLIEEFVAGTELAVGVLDLGSGAEALPAVEIQPLDGTYDFEARYNAGETRFYTPARVSAAVTGAVAEVAVRVHTELGLQHLSRIDLVLDAQGTPWFLEANVLPGLTETSLIPQALQAANRDPGETYSALAHAAHAASPSHP